MSENAVSNEHQDPADQYRVDEAVETTEQAPDAEPAAGEPNIDAPVEATPEAPVETASETPVETQTGSSYPRYQVTEGGQLNVQKD